MHGTISSKALIIARFIPCHSMNGQEEYVMIEKQVRVFWKKRKTNCSQKREHMLQPLSRSHLLCPRRTSRMNPNIHRVIYEWINKFDYSTRSISYRTTTLCAIRARLPSCSRGVWARHGLVMRLSVMRGIVSNRSREAYTERLWIIRLCDWGFFFLPFVSILVTDNWPSFPLMSHESHSFKNRTGLVGSIGSTRNQPLTRCGSYKKT